MDEEGAASIDALNQLLKKADKLMAVLKSPERIAAIAQHVAQHFEANVLPLNFKALIVTPDREACALYKQALDQHLRPEWSRVVYSSNPQDGPRLREHYLSKEEERRVRNSFRDEDELPRILIVTEKLLTGYDAPVAYAMYLDKPLRDHTLLQAIARVNRPYEGKENGLIVDYIGIFENLQRALSFDTQSITRGLIDLEQLKKQFVSDWEALEQQLAPAGLDGRNQIICPDRLIEHFFDEQLRETFFETFKKLEAAYEIIAPDAFLRPYIEMYARYADLFRSVISYFDPKGAENRLNRALRAKTETLIGEHVATNGPLTPFPLYPINENIADVIEADNQSDQVKVINLYRSLMTGIGEIQEEHPFLLSIAAEVKQIIERLQERQVSTETALQQLETTATNIANLLREREASPLDNLAFSISTVFQKHCIMDESNDLATRISDHLRANESWRFNEENERTVRRWMYGRILPVLPENHPTGIKTIVDDLFQMHRMNL